MTPFTYVGSELDLFARARNWKSYFRDRVSPWLGNDVLEVGAGFGGTTRFLCRGSERRWTCLEPDASLAGRLGDSIRMGELPSCCEVRVSTLADADESETFDTILYMDVLEHIEDDRAEVAEAARHLRPGGHLVALSPAHDWLGTPFDRAIGHYRRYTRATIRDLAPADLAAVRVDYLDSVGFFASLANRFVLRSAMPTPAQVAFWDRVLVRLSRGVDPILGFSAGKSVLAVWRKQAPGAIEPGRSVLFGKQQRKSRFFADKIGESTTARRPIFRPKSSRNDHVQHHDPDPAHEPDRPR